VARKAGKREPLSRERIELAALELIEKEGLDAFSIRRLGQALGYEAMSIYHYFPSKAHIMDALIDHILEEFFPFPPAELPWDERLRRVAHQWRDLLSKRPSLFVFTATHRLNTRKGLRWINETLKLCAGAGLSHEHTVRMFRTFGYYLNGAILDETAGYARGPSTVEPVPGEELARDYPEVVAAAPYFRASEWEATLAFGMDLLIEGYARLAEADRQNRKAAR
jgi:AcrR family transcriptional regulator